MILVDWQIKEWAQRNVHPFDEYMINPASIDFRAGTSWRDIQYPQFETLNKPVTVYQITIKTLLVNSIVDAIYSLTHKRSVLGYRRPTAVILSTLEKINVRRNMAIEVKLKTTPSREGLGSLVADWVDNGFVGQLSVIVTANKTITIKPNDRICQLVVHMTKTPSLTYDKVGHYQNQHGATPSWRQ